MDSDSRKPSPQVEQRLNRYLALCGFGARRKCDAIIASGRVTVDGRPVRGPGERIVSGKHRVLVDGRPATPPGYVYIAFNKPRDVICTASDPRGRRSFRAFMPDLPERVFTVGRLDRNSEGLLLVTNDGDLANRLTHPRGGVAKVYEVCIGRRLSDAEMSALVRGVWSEGERLSADAVSYEGPKRGMEKYSIRLSQGRNRQIRRMFESLGMAVRSLKRIQIGPLRLGALRSGRWRPLTEQEVSLLRSAAGSGCGSLRKSEFAPRKQGGGTE